MAINNLINDYALPIAGGTMTGDLILNADPTVALGACTKQYADAIAAGLDFKNTCVAASTTALTVTYSNGTAGVGATLTNADTQAAFAVDGQTLSAGQRVLIKNQASSFQNGIYTVTVEGSGATNWVLTRATDYDTIAEIAPGDLVPVDTGSTQAETLWLQTATVTAIGTDAITFNEFGANGTVTSITAGTGLTGGTITTSGTIALSSPVSGANGGTGVANTGKTITVGGNTEFSGAYTFTGTLTGNTAVTFPTSGTLATTAGSGSQILLSTINVTSGFTIDLFNLFSSAYDCYLVQFIGLQLDVSGEAARLRFGTGSTPTIQSGSSDYKYVTNEVTSAGSGSQVIDGTVTSFIALGPNMYGTAADTAATMSGNLYLYNAGSAALYTTITYDIVAQVTSLTKLMRAMGGAMSTFTTAVTSLQFDTNDPGVASYVAGKVKVYGIL